MTTLKMIAEWRKGCSNTTEFYENQTPIGKQQHPETCIACTVGLIDAIEKKARQEAQNIK